MTESDNTPRPHGGKLVDRVLDKRERESVLSELDDIPRLVVKEEALRDATNVATGIFSPLEGFVGEEELRSILHNKRLPDDMPWTMPILLSVPPDGDERLSEGDECLLTDSQGSCLIRLHVEEKFKFDKKEIAEEVFGTTDPRHPGVAGLLESEDLFIGGNVDLVREEHTPFDRFRLRPAETRVLFREKNWRTIVGFQTRNPPHLGHEWIQKIALTFSDGVFINPLI